MAVRGRKVLPIFNKGKKNIGNRRQKWRGEVGRRKAVQRPDRYLVCKKRFKPLAILILHRWCGHLVLRVREGKEVGFGGEWSLQVFV